jgi:AbiV family abortive infection protein
MAAAAALTNASELCAEAELLAKNGHNSRAAVLAVIGLEEFAVSVAYTAAAIFPGQSSGLRDRLNDHNVKHWIAAAFDGPEIVTSDKESLRNTFRELLKSRWGSFVLTKVLAKEATKKSQELLNDPQLHVLTTELITTPLIKNAALYMDIEEGKCSRLVGLIGMPITKFKALYGAWTTLAFYWRFFKMTNNGNGLRNPFARHREQA